MLFALVIIVWTLLGLPYGLLGPLFFADPLAALFGYYIKSPELYHSKTVKSINRIHCFVSG